MSITWIIPLVKKTKATRRKSKQTFLPITTNRFPNLDY